MKFGGDLDLASQEHFQKYCSHSEEKEEKAVFLGSQPRH
jgi:hypothetical protein